MEAYEEKRESTRYRCREDQMAYIAIRPAFKKIGTVMDVSRGGLGFMYNLLKDQEPMSEDSFLSIDLFMSNTRFYLRNVKCRLAYDRFEQNRSWAFYSGMQFRQCGLEFDVDELTAEQKEKIQLFLENHTVGEG